MNLAKAKHSGELKIGDLILSCAVLEDGQRILSERGVGDAIGTKASAKYWKDKKSGLVIDRPQYLAADNLQEFISSELKLKLSQSIPYISKSGGKANGIKAEVLPEICDVWLKAREKGVLTSAQAKTAEKAYILLKGFANVGIIALVDEATGYQYEREKLELQNILNIYIAKELMAWQKRFPDEFYIEIFRLNGWDFTVYDIKKRPGVIGNWTKTLIYKQLPKGVLDELKKITPKTTTGKYKARFHQSLTEDIGHPDLQRQIYSVLGVMRISDNWKDFINNFNKMNLRKSGQTELKFEDLEYREEPIKRIDKPTEFDKTLKAILSVPQPNKN